MHFCRFVVGTVVLVFAVFVLFTRLFLFAPSIPPAIRINNTLCPHVLQEFVLSTSGKLHHLNPILRQPKPRRATILNQFPPQSHHNFTHIHHITFACKTHQFVPQSHKILTPDMSFQLVIKFAPIWWMWLGRRSCAFGVFGVFACLFGVVLPINTLIYIHTCPHVPIRTHHCDSTPTLTIHVWLNRIFDIFYFL